MTTIKLEIPTNDPSALFHMGEALRNIAKENGYVVQDAPVLKVNESDFAEWSKTLTKASAARRKLYSCPDEIGSTINASEDPFYGDAGRNMSGLMNHPKSSLEDILDNPPAATDELKELLSPHVTVVEYETDIDAVTTSTSDNLIDIVTTGTSDELIDADGLPHDKRIHSRGKTRLADDTWRMKKKPSDQTDEEWAEFVDGVKAELKQLMDIPVATGEALDVLAASIGLIRQEAVVATGEALKPPTLDELAVADLEQSTVETMFASVTPIDTDTSAGMSQVNAEVVTPPVVTPPVVTPPVVTPPVVTPPVVTPPVVTPPVVTPPTDSDAPTTFPLFMKWLTTNNKKLTSDMVNQVLNDNGVKAIPLLTTRVDLIPQIHAELVKLL